VEVKVQWNGKMGFTGTGPSGHSVFMDAAPKVGGDDRGPRPTELALMSIGGCSGIDIMLVLQAMRVQVDDLEITLTAERAAEEPRRFTRINIHYRITGPELPERRIKRAVDLTRDKYCSVSNSFNAEITTSYELIETGKAAEA